MLALQRTSVIQRYGKTVGQRVFEVDEKTGGALAFKQALRPESAVRASITCCGAYLPSAACWTAFLSGVPAAVFAGAAAAAARVSARVAGAAAVVFARLAAFCCLPHSSAESSVAPGSASARPSGAPDPASGGAVPVAADASDRAAGLQEDSGSRRWAERSSHDRYRTFQGGRCATVGSPVDLLVAAY